MRIRHFHPRHQDFRRLAAGALLFALVLLGLSCVRKVEARVRDGDIIFQTSQSEQSQAIQIATHSPFSHMGLVLFKDGRPFVLEAVSPSVRFTPLREWIARGEKARFVVKRLRDASVLADPNGPSSLMKAASEFSGKPYDPYFEWSDDRIYCSELVWKAYERGLGVHLGVAVHLARRGEQEARALVLREAEGVVRPVRARLQRQQGLAHVVDRARKRGEVVDEVDGLVDLQVLDHVVVAEDELVVAQVRDVLEGARLEVVHADHAVPLAEQVLAEVGAEKTGSAGHDSGRHHAIVSAALAGSGRFQRALRSPYAALNGALGKGGSQCEPPFLARRDG